MEKKKYSSYNGMARSAMVWGIPLIPGLVVFTTFIIGALLLQVVIGSAGLFFAVLGIPILLYCKFLCETDDQAIRMLVLEVWCYFQRRSSAGFGKTYTLAPIKYGRKVDVYKRLFEKPARH
jgi:type IV secretion system protein VirB3